MRWRALFLVSFLLWPTPVRGDGGVVRFSGRAGDYQVTVFTAPNPLRAGPVDVSVFVQDPATGGPVPGVAVHLRLSRDGGPLLQIEATREAATNKLFHCAKFELPAAGRWHAQFALAGGRSPANLELDLAATEAPPPWSEYWAWIAMPLVPIGLFVAHQILSRTTSRRVNPGGSAGLKPAARPLDSR